MLENDFGNDFGASKTVLEAIFRLKSPNPYIWNLHFAQSASQRESLQKRPESGLKRLTFIRYDGFLQRRQLDAKNFEFFKSAW